MKTLKEISFVFQIGTLKGSNYYSWVNGLFLLFALLSLSQKAIAQDMHYTQFYASPVYLNPAMTGLNVCSRVTLTYRNQWPGISRAFNSYMLSSDHFIPDAKLGVGMLMAHDEAGTGNLMTTIISPSLAYEMRVSQEFGIRFGLQPGLAQRRINYNKLVFGDQIARGGVWMAAVSAETFRIALHAFL